MTGRIVGFVLAGLLNVGIVYALATGLASTAVKLAIQNIKVAVIKPPAPDTSKPPPPPPPQMKEPPPFVPPPDINIDITEAAPATTAITETTNRAPAPAPAAIPNSPPRPANNHQIGPNEYPPISIRLNEQGTVTVKLLVLEDGTVGESQIVQSSGHDRLDQAALVVTKQHWRYHPAIQNGKPVQQWITASVVFRLR